jgi:plasmid stabilization system protein ParE
VKGRPVVLREAARRDIDEALAFYLDEGSEATALAIQEPPEP